MNPHRTRTGQICSTLLLTASASLAQTPATARLDPPAAPQADIKTVAPAAPAQLPVPTRIPSATAKPHHAGSRAEAKSGAQSTPQVDHTRMYLESDAAGAIWARGAGYKARFDSSGMDFVPFFGSKAPRNFDLNLALASVSCGGSALELDTNATPTRVDSVVTFDRGDVSEVFELTPASVEHKFVLATLPGAGDLHVRVSFASELVAKHEEDGFHFENEYGYVQYGNATAIDAAGRTLALRSALIDGAIDIEVPASFAAEARLPLTIDPLINLYPIESVWISSLNPDVVYDGSGSYVMHCWEEIFSAGDSDVFAGLYDLNGYPVGGTQAYVDYTYENWVRPRCAYQYAANRYIITAQVGAPGSRAIWGRVRADNAGGFDSGKVQLSDPGTSGEKLNADVGADPFPGLAYFLLVYERVYSFSDRDVHARLIDSSGAPVSTIYVDNSGGTIDEVPSVSKTNNTGNWNIAWQRETSSGSHDIFGAKVYWQGSITYPTFPISTYSLDETNPSAAGSIVGSERFVVAYEMDYSTDHDILLTLVDGSTTIAQMDLSVAEGSYFLQDQRWPALECDGSHFVCAYSELLSAPYPNYDPMIAEVGTSGFAFTLGEAHLYVDWSYVDEFENAIASRRSSNLNSGPNQYVMAFAYRGAAWGYSDDLWGAFYTGTVGGPIYSFCEGGPSTCPCGTSQNPGAGCGNSANSAGAWLTAYGSPSTSTDNLTMSYGGMPAGVSALLFQSFNVINGGSGNPFGDGRRCVGTPAFRFPIRITDSNGNAEYGYNMSDIPISVRGSVPYLGATVFYQTWYRDGATYCTPAGTNFTNALQVYWTP